MVYKDTHKTKDGRCYYFRVQINNVPYKSKRYLTKEEAKKEEAIYRLNHKSINHTLFSVVANAYFDNLKTYCKYSTIYTYQKDYNKHIYPYFHDKDIYSINTLDYNLWYENMAKKGFKIKYTNKVNSLLRNIFNYAIQNYNLEHNPVIKTFKEPKDKIITEEKLRYITKEDFNKFISVIDDDMYKLLFETLFYTGIRKGELLCLTWNDVDLVNKSVKINKTFYKIHDNTPTSNKTNQVRTIYLNNAFVQNMANYKANRMSFKDFSNDWYVFGDVRTLSTTQIERKKHHYFELSGVKEITIHEFRHSHVSMLVNEYLKTDNDSTKFFIMMSQRLGHSIPVMQKTYMHLFPNTQDDIVNMLNKLS